LLEFNQFLNAFTYGCLMELDTQTREKLNAQLAFLPPKAALALLREVRRDEERGGNSYPHEFVAGKLNENLKDQGFDEELLGQPWAMFCEPFQAFLVDKKNDPRQRGSILRESSSVIWNWLWTELLSDQLPDQEFRIIQALGDDRRDDAKAMMAAFHKQAGDRIWSQLSGVEEGSREHLSYNAKFGKPGVFEDAMEMARALQIAPPLIQLRGRMRTGLTLSHDEDVRHCHVLYQKFLQAADNHIELGMMLMASRLEKPYEVIKIIQHHVGDELDTIILSDPASQSATLVLCDLEDSIQDALKLISQYREFSLVAEKITEFYNCTAMFTSVVEISTRSVWGNRIIQIRNILSAAIKQQIEQLPRLIKSLRYKNKGSLFPSSAGDSTSGPNAYDVNQAIYIARLLDLSGRFLSQLSINDAFAKARNEAINFLESVSEINVSELAKAELGEKNKILEYFKPVVELTLILQGEERAALLERRGGSAFRAQPAKSQAGNILI